MRNFLLLLLIFGILGILLFLFWPTPIAPPPPPPPPPALADWGDAPDPDPGMDTGYYEPVSSPANPLIMTYQNAGVAAQFPTDDAGPQGPYALDVDDVWIGPMAVPPFFLFPGIGLVAPAGPAAGDIPSVEAGVYDPADPDTVSNLLTVPPSTMPNKADCDRENSTHFPATQIGAGGMPCSPVPPYTIGMNGRLIIVVGNPPLAIFLTRIWFGTPVSPAIAEGGVYWNLLFDTDQDGEWSGLGPTGEWIAVDQVVPYSPPSTLVVSPVFEWGISGTPFGRLLFPVWARSMVTTESVAATVAPNPADYHGEGPDGGFAAGEIEDYFVEWRPIGQMFDGGGPGGGGRGSADGGDGDAAREGLAELLPVFAGPDEIAAGVTEYEVSTAELRGVGIICVPPETAVASGAATVPATGEATAACAAEGLDVAALLEGNRLALTVGEAAAGTTILLLGSFGDDAEFGTALLPVHGGKLVSVAR